MNPSASAALAVIVIVAGAFKLALFTGEVRLTVGSLLGKATTGPVRIFTSVKLFQAFTEFPCPVILTYFAALVVNVKFSKAKEVPLLRTPVRAAVQMEPSIEVCTSKID